MSADRERARRNLRKAFESFDRELCDLPTERQRNALMAALIAKFTLAGTRISSMELAHVLHAMKRPARR